ncbi:MAG: DUF4956 domain-containing protein [Clostridia bacterium]|nr:DUF4956 domain-containing protein [Clostridia bacterium]
MQNTIFKGLFDSETATVIPVEKFILCIGVSLLIGVFLALVYAWKSRYTKSFVMTLSMLPAVVCAVIMMVNGNIGAGVAVAGAFSLVRFRSVPGTAKEIATIFLAMGAGLIAGMGYLAYAVLFSLILGVIMLVFNFISYKSALKSKERILKITIPENLNYTDVFEKTFEKYTTSHTLTLSKTSNMGSMYKLTYKVNLKNLNEEKAFIDDIRCLNGNLEVSLSLDEVNICEL